MEVWRLRPSSPLAGYNVLIEAFTDDASNWPLAIECLGQMKEKMVFQWFLWWLLVGILGFWRVFCEFCWGFLVIFVGRLVFFGWFLVFVVFPMGCESAV